MRTDFSEQESGNKALFESSDVVRELGNKKLDHLD